MTPKARASNDVIALTVLILLSEEPMHPYQIERVIRERHKGWAMGRTRSLYHAVDHLVADELIEPLETSRDGKRPERTVYTITDLGRDEHRAWLVDLIEQPAPEHPLFLIAMSFVAYLGSPAALQRAELEWVRSIVAEIESGNLHWDEEYLRHHFEMTRVETSAKKGETE